MAPEGAMSRRVLLRAGVLLGAVLACALLALPSIRWPLWGWMRGEAFYEGRPTSYWRWEIHVYYGSSTPPPASTKPPARCPPTCSKGTAQSVLSSGERRTTSRLVRSTRSSPSCAPATTQRSKR